ncbi:MAG: hypothetical protein LBS12_05770 [Prevotellaceae bacterium]|jgi:hypothetical protein|nr:hypothetical protein [Prevotellaceae bacterium]
MKKILVLAALFSLAAGFVACSNDDEPDGQAPGKAVISGATANLWPQTSVLLTATAEGATEYKWYKGSAGTTPIPGVTTNTFAVTVSDVYYVAGVNENGEGAKSNPHQVDITAFDITLTGASVNACPATSVELTANMANATAYAWYRNGTKINGETANVYTATESGSYTVAGIRDGVEGDKTAPLVVALVDCPAPPKATVSGAAANTCPAASVELTASVNDPGLTAYKWYKGNIEIPGATTNKYVVTESGSYTAAGVNANGTGAKSDVKVVTITTCQVPPEKAAIAGNASNTCPATSVLLTAAAGGATSFQWYNGAAVISGATLSTYSATASGSYYVEGINTYGTGAKSDAKAVTINACGSSNILFEVNMATSSEAEWDSIAAYTTFVDADGDGYNWGLYYMNEARTEFSFLSFSYDNPTATPLTPENYLLLPGKYIGTNAKFTFTVKGLDSNWAKEKFKVIILTLDQVSGITTIADLIPILRSATVLHTHTLTNEDPYTQTLNIPSSYNGLPIFMGIAHFDCTDQFALQVTQVKLEHTPSGAPPVPAPAYAPAQVKQNFSVNSNSIMQKKNLSVIERKR